MLIQRFLHQQEHESIVMFISKSNENIFVTKINFYLNTNQNNCDKICHNHAALAMHS